MKLNTDRIREKAFRVCIIATFLSASFRVNAQTNEKEPENYSELSLEQLLNVEVSVSGKTNQKIDEVQGSVRIITRRQIEDMNARTLRDILNVLIPGVDVVPVLFKSGYRINEGISARGVRSNFGQSVLILYNGRNKFNDATFGSSLASVEFTLENIDRIEVSTTPVPIQGGNAITTINLITRDQSINEIEGSVNTAVSDNISRDGILNKKITITGGREIKGWHIGGSAQYYDDKGIPHPDTMGTAGYKGTPGALRDGIFGAGNVSLNVLSPGKKIEIGSWYKFNRQQAFLTDLSPSQSAAPFASWGSVWSSYISYNPTRKLSFTAGNVLSKWGHRKQGTDPEGFSVKNYDIYAEGLFSDTIKKHTLVAGMKVEREGKYGGADYVWNGTGFSEENAEAMQKVPNLSRTIYSVFAEDNWKFHNKFTLLLGGRFDFTDNFSDKKLSALNPRAGITYTPSRKIIMKALVASAMRPPALFETRGREEEYKGNPDVHYERMYSAEFNFIYKTNKFRAQVVPFYQVLSDRIEIEAEADSLPATAINEPGYAVAGIDLQLDYFFNQNTYLFLNASHQTVPGNIILGNLLIDKHDGEEEEHHDHAENDFLPTVYINGGANIRAGKFNFNMTASFRGKRIINDNLSAYKDKVGKAAFWSNLSISYYLKENLKIYLLAENWTNSRINIPLGAPGAFYPLRGRIINAGVVMNFNRKK